MKHLLTLIALTISMSFANAQFSSRCSVTTTIPDRYLPTGYQLDTAQDLTHRYRIAFARTYDASTYDGSPAADAFETLAYAVKASFTGGVAYSAFGVDTSALADVHANIIITNVTRGWPCVRVGDRADIYDPCEDIFTVSGYFEWDK